MGKRARGDAPRAGTYAIDTGEAELVAEGSRGGWLLLINGEPSSHILPGQPEHLSFAYLRWCAAAVEHVVDARLDPLRLRVTHLGGAAATLPCYLAHRYPRSRNTVVELDAELSRLVREWFDIPRAPSVKIRVGEARGVLEACRPGSRDVVIRDVFANARTPRPLTTVEFFRCCAESLSPGGLYVANCGAARGVSEVRAELAGMGEVFPHLGVMANPTTLRGRRAGNVVVLGSTQPLPTSAEAASGPVGKALSRGSEPARYHSGTWVQQFLSGAHPRYDET